jgi:hypothetical protein
MKGSRYGVQIRITGGSWVWVASGTSLTRKAVQALSWESETDAAEALDYLRSTRPSQDFRLVSMFAADRG